MSEDCDGRRGGVAKNCLDNNDIPPLICFVPQPNTPQVTTDYFHYVLRGTDRDPAVFENLNSP